MYIYNGIELSSVFFIKCVYVLCVSSGPFPWLSDVLLQGEVKIITNQECRKAWEGLMEDITDDVVCTAYDETRPHASVVRHMIWTHMET